MISLYDLTLTSIHGVGSKKATELNGINIHSIGDLLDYLPFRYDDYRIRPLAELQDADKATLQATIATVGSVQRFGRMKSRISCKVIVEGKWITAVWFNQHFLKERLIPGTEFVITGRWDAKRSQLTVSETEFPSSRQIKSGSVQPVYALQGEVTQSFLRKLMLQALAQYGADIAELLPDEIIRKHGLISRSQAIIQLHQPTSEEEMELARHRMAFEELFIFQLKLQALRAWTRDRTEGIAHTFDREVVRKFVRSLPFPLTDAQKTVVSDLLNDLEHPACMNRLLQGDVGSGKTVVAAIAMFAVASGGGQVAMMVPTEILAEQHARTLKEWFAPYGITAELLTGRTTTKQRRSILSGLQSGMVQILIGTHALIQPDVYFEKLALVVTDEQHRFGVEQRAMLRRKGPRPDVLAMTATPIPRTLAISAFGDMDVSTINEMPKGRKPIQTHWVRKNKLDQVMAFIRKQLEEGRQAYVICPLIEESEKLDVQNAIALHAQLQDELGEYEVALLHGRMTSALKDEAMQAFSSHQSHVLVSTTVVEVGVNVPNATVMVIYDADRFGLSQLHQLRGRVGRGEHQSYCVLVADAKSETAQARLQVMKETNDGFEISRKDLELRGPGDFFGTKQSGLPDFRFADFLADFHLMEVAREEAGRLTAQPDFWTAYSYQNLRDLLQKDERFTGIIVD
jgi:ATP-dependent DNA helicase RecG